jgi:hypothetical protein
MCAEAEVAGQPGRSMSFLSSFHMQSFLGPWHTKHAYMQQAAAPSLHVVSAVAITSRVGVGGGHAVLVVTRLAVFVVGAPLADTRGLGVVAGADLVRTGVHGQGVGVAQVVRVGALVAAQAKEPPLRGGPVARRVVVCRGGAEALLLLAVAAQGEFCQG